MSKKYVFVFITVFSLLAVIVPAIFVSPSVRNKSNILSGEASVVEMSVRPAFNDNNSHFLYIESKGRRSTIWAASADDIARSRQKVISVTHAIDTPIKATLSPNNDFISYTLIPKEVDPTFDGSLWLVGIDGKSPSLVDKNVDYAWPPRWSPDGKTFFYQKLISQEDREHYYSEFYIANTNSEKRLLFTDKEALAVIPIGWSPDGSTIFVDRIQSDGDSIYKVDSKSGQVQFLAPVSHTAAWNLSLSSDGEQILGSVLNGDQQNTYSVISISTKTGSKKSIMAGSYHHYTPIWSDENKSVITNIPSDGNIGKLHTIQADGEVGHNTIARAQWPNQYNTVPLSYSLDKQWLAVELYSNTSVQIALMQKNTQVINIIPSPNYVGFIGWLK